MAVKSFIILGPGFNLVQHGLILRLLLAQAQLSTSAKGHDLLEVKPFAENNCAENLILCWFICSKILSPFHEVGPVSCIVR
jgi:hypothetical protein